jgi:aminoglycoside phosphotransferase (APT) family kinase protein
LDGTLKSANVDDERTRNLNRIFASQIQEVVRAALQGIDHITDLRRLPGGASQEIWTLEAVGPGLRRRLILRRQPPGAAYPDKINLEIEAELMRVVEAAGVPTPQVIHVLTPADGIGRGFLMEHVEGEGLGHRIVRSEAFAAIRPKLAFQIGGILARIHGVDTALLPMLPRKSAASEVTDMHETYRRFSQPRPVFERSFCWLRERMDTDAAARTLVHGDFRNGNMIVGPDGLRAVLDWELAHLGDPMSDLGWLCTNSWRYGEIDKPVGGFGDRDDLVSGYEAAGGAKIDPAALHYWEALGTLRWGVMCIEMAARAKQSDRPVELSMIGRRASEAEIDLLRLIAPRRT